MRSIALLLAVVLGACSSSSFEPTRAHDVLVTLTVPGPCVSAVCDPGGNSGALGLISVVNHGTATAYIERCGPLAFITQQFVDGKWVSLVGPAVTCVASPVVAITAGDSVRSNRTFTPGRWRLLLGVATTADMSDATQAISTAVSVF